MAFVYPVAATGRTPLGRTLTRFEGALDLRVVGELGGSPRRGGVAEVTAPIGVELGEAAKLRQDRGQRMERRGRALLRPELRVEDAPVGIIERDDEILGLAREPLVGRGIEMEQHPHQGAAFALAPVLAAGGRLGREPSRVHVYERVNWCFSVACSQKCWIEKSA